MPSITARTNGVYDDFSQFKDDLVCLTNGVDENIFVNEAGTSKNLGILRPDASSMTVTLSGTGGTNGTVNVYVVYLNATFGEIFRSMPSPVKQKVVASNESSIALASIPTSSDTQVTSREIYWTAADDTEAKLVTTINDNTTTTLVATTIASNTGRNLADAPAIWKRQLFPKCKYNIVYDGRLVLANQSDNRIVAPYRDGTSFDLSAVTSTTVFTDSALTSLDINAANVFVGMRLKMTSGAADTDIRTISAYNSATGAITVDTALSATPSASDTYEIHGLLNGSTLYFSERFAYEGYDDGTDGLGGLSTVTFDNGDGAEITGLATFTQERGDSTLGALVVFKPHKIFFMKGLPSSWSRELISDHYGCIANRSIVPILEQIYFLGNRMIYRLSKTGSVEEIGIPIYTTIYDNINWDKADTAQGVHWKDMYLLAVPWGTSVYPNKVLVFNYRFNTWHIWDFGLNITAMNRDFADDGTELLEIAIWDVNNSNAEVWQVKESVQTDNGDGTEYTATSGTATTITESAQSWTTNEFQSRVITIIAGTGAGQSQQVVSNTATAITVPASWATTPDSTSVFAIGLIDYWYETPDIQTGSMQGATASGYDFYAGTRNSSDTDKVEITQYEAFSSIAAKTAVEYTLGSGQNGSDDPEYLKATVDMKSPNMRFKVRSKRIGQTFSFRNATLSLRNNDRSY